MASLKDAVAAMKREMVSLAQSGHAARRRGIIVTPRILEALKEEERGQFTGRIGVRGTEGNRRIHYSFYVLADPSLLTFDPDAAYLFVHHDQAVYESGILGRIPAVMAADRRTANFGWGGITIQELNPIMGAVEVKYGGGSHYYYQADYDAVVATGRAALSSDKDPANEIYARFDEYNLILNPPETEWLGRLEFDDHTGYLKSVDKPPEPYLLVGLPEQRHVGRLLMRTDPLRIVGVARDGYGHIREIPVVPFGKWGDEDDIPFSHFAPVAIQYFLPEEIFVACWRHSLGELEYIRSLPVHEWWGQWYDPERVGRVEEFTRTGSQSGFVLSTGCVNTRAKERDVEIVFVPENEKDRWENLRQDYFPSDWEGWPETRMDKTLSQFAANL